MRRESRACSLCSPQSYDYKAQNGIITLFQDDTRDLSDSSLTQGVDSTDEGDIKIYGIQMIRYPHSSELVDFLQVICLFDSSRLRACSLMTISCEK